MVLVPNDVVGHWQQSLFQNTRISALIECQYLGILQARVFVDDFESILVSIEGVHQDKGDRRVELRVQRLDLLHSQVQETLFAVDLNDTLGTSAAHRGSQSSIELQHHQLIGELLKQWSVGTQLLAREVSKGGSISYLLGSWETVRELRVWHHHILMGRLDLLPLDAALLLFDEK